MEVRPKKRYSLVSRMLNPEGRKGKLRLDKNEHVVGLPPQLIMEALSTLTPEDIAAYPEVRPFYKKLSCSLGLSESNLMVTAGSDPGIKSVYELFVGDGDAIVLTKPTYAMFHVYAQIFGATVKNVHYRRDLSIDTHAILEAISKDVQMVAVANPNSPTGTVLDEEFLLTLVEKSNQCGVVVLIDEAYHPFHRGTMMSHVGAYDNLVVTRTFSKAYGLAGSRLGYLAGSRYMINLLMKVRPMYEITGIAAHLGCYVLDHQDEISSYVEKVNIGKKHLEDEMKTIGFPTHPSHANFLHVKIEDGSLRAKITQGLFDRGILVTGTQGFPLEDCVRITLGPLEQMEIVADSIREIIED